MVQISPGEMIQILHPWFQKRYEPNFAWKSACSAFMALPGLRGFWPMGAVDSNGDAQDQSGHGHHLTDTGPPAYNVRDLAPYVDLDGASDYLSRTDEADLDITGTETYMATAMLGLTLGGWFYPDAIEDVGLIAKWNDNGVNQRSYRLRLDVPSNDAMFQVSSDGTAVTTAQTTTVITASAWYFIVGRFRNADNDINIFVNGTWETPTVYNNTIFSGSADLNVGAFNNGQAAARLDGRASMCFLCAAQLNDSIVFSLYEQTRAMYGV